MTAATFNHKKTHNIGNFKIKSFVFFVIKFTCSSHMSNLSLMYSPTTSSVGSLKASPNIETPSKDLEDNQMS